MAARITAYAVGAACTVAVGVWVWQRYRKEKKRPDKVVFAITGFGKFGGVDNNPTEVLVKALPSFMRSNPLGKNATIDRCQILEVSGQGAKEGLEDIRNTVFQSAGQQRVWLHLGVDANAKTFKLEKCAWNEAKFRIADERGWEPKDECIVADEKKGARLQTSLPLSSLCSNLKKKGYRVEVSRDPGRFVCNWLYFLSLKTCASNKAPMPGVESDHVSWEDSLFVHVPPFEACDSAQQIAFVRELMMTLGDLLCVG